MRFNPWAAALSLCGALLLTACGGSGSGSKAHVRLLNAAPSFAKLDLSNNNATLNSGVAYASAGSYADVDTSNTASNVLNSTTGQSVAATTPTLTGGNNYTIIAYGNGSTVRTALLGENETAPDTGKAKLLVLNLAQDAGTLDVYLTGTSDPLSSATPLSSGYNLLNAGTFRVRVTGQGAASDLRLDLPAVTLGSGSVNTLILLGTPSGVLVNAQTLVQQGAVTNAPNTLARVRGLFSVPTGGIVSGSINGSPLNALSSAVTPARGEYTSVTAGANQVVSFAYNGSTLTAPAVTLTAGNDYTLLVWGDTSVAPFAPQFKWNVDDNRLPLSSSNAKLRMINGLNPGAPSLDVTVDLTALATNVVAGSFSDYKETPSSTTAAIEVSSPGALNSLFSATNQTLKANGVYTVFVMGSNAAPVVRLRQER
jgi:hypothetical protein